MGCCSRSIVVNVTSNALMILTEKNCVLLNSAQEFIKTEAWLLLLTLSKCYTIN